MQKNLLRWLETIIRINKFFGRRVYSRILVTCSKSQEGELTEMKPKEKHSRIMHLVSENNKMIRKRVNNEVYGQTQS